MVNYYDENINNNNIISGEQNIFVNNLDPIDYIYNRKNFNLNDYQNNSININLNINENENNINERNDNINNSHNHSISTNIIDENVNSHHINLNNAYLCLPSRGQFLINYDQPDSFLNNETVFEGRIGYINTSRILSLESFNGTDENRKKLVDNLLEYELYKVDKLEEGNKKCVICLEYFKDGDKIISLPCVHIYHGNCIKKWLLETNFCPIYKYTFNDDEIK